MLDSNCNIIDSTSGVGNIFHDFNITNEDFYTIKIRNTTENQIGQKCWVKVTYQAPDKPNLSIVKNKCSCSAATKLEDAKEMNYSIYPNPAHNWLNIIDYKNSNQFFYLIYDLNGKIVNKGNSYNGKIYLYMNKQIWILVALIFFICSLIFNFL